jgi:hypothetical protein
VLDCLEPVGLQGHAACMRLCCHTGSFEATCLRTTLMASIKHVHTHPICARVGVQKQIVCI